MITGQCRCGETKFEINGEIPEKLTRCTCSFCSKRGMLYAYYKPEQFKLLTPVSDRAEYRWNTKQAGLYFCATCGCGTYNDSPDFQKDGSWDGKTRRFGVNARLFDNFVAANAPFVEIDGKNLW